MSSLLPIGTVVTIQSNTKSDTKILCMIMGYYPVDHEKEEMYLYSAVLYPYGIDSIDSCLLLNKEDIVEVVFQGYCDEEGDKLTNTLPYIIELFKQQN